MQMHLYSSYHIYAKHLLPDIPENVVFIDIGCGPLTSGIAFWAVASECNITYLGIDRSQARLNKAKEINQFGPSGPAHSPFFKRVHFIEDFSKLPSLIDSFEIGVPNQTLILLNFCYVLASRTINVKALSIVLNQITERYREFRIAIVYQNPVSDRSPELSFLHEKWFDLKPTLTMFTSQVNTSNIEEFRIARSDSRYSVYFDLLYKIDRPQWSIHHGTTIPF